MTERGKETTNYESTAASTHVTGAATSTRELSPSAAVYDILCGICFTAIHPVDNPRGKINSCEHLFCSHCIKEWAKNTNVCPSCKARFTRIYTIIPNTEKVEETKVRKRNYKAWEQSYYSNDESFNDDSEMDGSTSEEELLESNELIRCMICHSAANASRIIFCDRRQCTYAAHLDCLHLHERPLTFLCPECTELRQAESSLSSASGSNSAGQCIDADKIVSDDYVCSENDASRQVSKLHNVSDTNNSTNTNSFANDDEQQRVSSTADRHADNAATTTTGNSYSMKSKESQTPQLSSPSHFNSVHTNSTVDFSRINLPFIATQQHQLHENEEQQSMYNSNQTVRGYKSTNSNNGINSYVDNSRGSHGRAIRADNTISNGRSGSSNMKNINNIDSPNDDLYFLAPSPHASAALNDLHHLAELRRHDAEMRQTRLLTRGRQWQEAHYSTLLQNSPHRHAVYNYLPTHKPVPSLSSTLSTAPTTTNNSNVSTTLSRGKRARAHYTNSHCTTPHEDINDYTELETKLLEEEVANYTDPHRRIEMEDRLAREWAREVMPNLRKQYDIAHQRLQLNNTGGIVMRAPESREERESKERSLWNEAMRQARQVVQQKLNATARQLRLRQEQLVQARAVREAAALAKLARVIALHRQQEQEQGQQQQQQQEVTHVNGKGNHHAIPSNETMLHNDKK